MPGDIRNRLPNDPRADAILRVWIGNGLSAGTIGVYSRWVKRFLAHAAMVGFNPDKLLTQRSADRFATTYARTRGIDRPTCQASARHALRAWSWGLAGAGFEVGAWKLAVQRRKLPPILDHFVRHRTAQRGTADSTINREVEALRGFLGFLRSRRRPVARVRLADIDDYVLGLRPHLAPRTVARACYSIRVFLRVLHATGRLRYDLASSVVGPRIRCNDQPPRALPWTAVRRILRGIDRTTPVGRRDYAILLTMAMYGLGSAEVRAVRLDDFDWDRGRVQIRRPKTGQVIELPLSPAVAQAILAYLRNGRPKYTASRAVFVQMHAPHDAFGASSAIRHILVKHARAAGIQDGFLGSHALRHSHATRQFDLGAPPKVVADILGHRSPTSTSVYVRAAVTRLRALALPVPR